MEQIYKGKTKDVYRLTDGNYLLQFKDDACGEDGVFDPGANQIGLTIDGKGKAGLRLSEFFFEKINSAGYPTHFISCDVQKAQMTVRPAVIFGSPGNGIEVICRYKAAGSFVRRYGQYIKDGDLLDSLVEVTLKDDERGDPPVTRDTLIALNILTGEEYETLVELTRAISAVIQKECAEKGLELIDLKLEFGRDSAEPSAIMLIDEVSADIMRVLKDGEPVSPIQLTEILTN